jgi:hypothetical protein
MAGGILEAPAFTWADETRGKGKRGGLRVIYYLLADDHQIWCSRSTGKVMRPI